MAANYDEYKTPFFTVEVADYLNIKKFMRLPHHIHRLIEKVEIHESLEKDTFTAITLEIIEGSREPFSTDAQQAAKDLYTSDAYNSGTDKDISGSITNRSGAITDLRFNGQGITWLDKAEAKAGAVNNTPMETLTGAIITRTNKNEHPTPVFLFQEGNLVKVTWGYLEAPHRKRSIVGRIATVSVTFPDNGPTTTTITCLPTKAFVDILAIKKGIKFGTSTTTPAGADIVTFTDSTPEEVITKIATDNGLNFFTSTNLLGPRLDNHHQKMWIGGESFKQFMDKLAEEHNAMWDLIPNPKTGVDTLIFIKWDDFDAVLVIADRGLTKYKSPGSLIKNISIRADFTAIVGAKTANLGSNGIEVGSNTDVNIDLPVFKNNVNGKYNKAVQGNPVKSGINIPAVTSIHNKLAQGDMAGHVEIHPSESQSKQDGLARSHVSLRDRMIELEFSMIGFPSLTPGAVEFGNIGVRYSGKYRVQTVTHTLDNNGYTTTGTATSFSIAAGGVTTKAPKAKEPPDPKTTLDLFDIQGRNAASNSPMPKYLDFKNVSSQGSYV